MFNVPDPSPEKKSSANNLNVCRLQSKHYVMPEVSIPVTLSFKEIPEQSLWQYGWMKNTRFIVFLIWFITYISRFWVHIYGLLFQWERVSANKTVISCARLSHTISVMKARWYCVLMKLLYAARYRWASLLMDNLCNYIELSIGQYKRVISHSNANSRFYVF